MNIEIGEKVKFIINTSGEPSPVDIGSKGVVISKESSDYYEVKFPSGYYGFYHVSELEIV